MINNGISIKSRNNVPCYPMYPDKYSTVCSLTVHQAQWNLLYEHKCFIIKVQGYQSNCKPKTFPLQMNCIIMILVLAKYY